MAIQTAYNSFQYGMIDEVFRRRADLQFAQASASKLINAVPLRTGGLKIREGCVKILDMAKDVVRIISFNAAVGSNYIIALAPQKMYVCGLNATGQWTILHTLVTEYSKAEINEVQFAQCPDKVVFTQWNHPPLVLLKSLDNAFSLTPLSKLLVTKTNEPDYIYDYKDLIDSPNNYPACVAFCNQRLTLMGTKKSPYGIWMSRPFDYFNFQEVDRYSTVNDKATTDQYLKAIEGSKISSIDNGDGTTTKTNTVVSPDGYVVITEGKYSNSTGALIGEEKKTTYNYMESVVEWKTVQREDCAIHLELGGSRDEHICWASSLGNYLIIGTASSEMVMPANISATKLDSYTPTSFYGSVQGRQCAFGDNMIFFIQSGSQKVRSVSYSYYEGGQCVDMSFLCGDILKAGIKEISWQRVQEPRLYVVLKDGTIATLTYDRQSGVNAWCLWNNDNVRFESLTVIDIDDGQSVLALVEKNGEKMIAEFKQDVYSDLELPISVQVVTNNLDALQTITVNKKISQVFIDTMGCRVNVMQEGNTRRCTTREQNKDLFEIIPYSISAKDRVRLIIENEAGMPFYLLYLAVVMEVAE